MEIGTEELPGGVTLRLAAPSDASALCAAYVENRDFLAPWEPRRPEGFFTVEGQAELLEVRMREFTEGRLVPWVFDSRDRIAGTIMLTGITLGPFCSAYLGYWVAADHQGHGLATAAVQQVCRIARDSVGLHRIEATTLLDNTRSQRVLEKCGFEPIGTAPRYLHVNGEWRDHRMFQRILHDDDLRL
ncbi:GNAT family N-acetyltransferase [Streptomyces sp. GESEQ-35]|uniref:GNAT family N-acetyltransferase n=1 Tax=Streptomyces sp. GESEQ-35 TaxID=2812657 RepID=UPI001B340516|nr:GNAT family protein [Streptomyces sp. GESEQ-35]